jgi:hypothetical protein
MRAHADLCDQMPDSLESLPLYFPLAQPLHTIA